MVAENKNKKLSAAQLRGLPVSVSEARKLLLAEASKLSDEEVARKIMQLSEFGRLVLRTLDLQK